MVTDVDSTALTCAFANALAALQARRFPQPRVGIRPRPRRPLRARGLLRPAVLSTATAAERRVVELEGMDDDTIWPRGTRARRSSSRRGFSTSAARRERNHSALA